MGFGGISIWQLLIILAIVVLLFGTKKLRNIGGDLGSAIKNFKKSVKDGQDEGTQGPAESAAPEERQIENSSSRVFDAEVEHKNEKKA